MVTLFSRLPIVITAILWPFSLSSYENNVNPDRVKESLFDLAFHLSPQNQVRVIQEAEPKLSPEALLALYDLAKENGPVFLKERVKEALNQLALLPSANQVLSILEAHPQLSPEAFHALYEQAKENGDVFLKERVKEALYQLALLPSETQVLSILEAHPQLSPEALIALYDQNKKNGRNFLEKLLSAQYSKEEQQDLINGLQKQPTYASLLKTDSLCSDVSKTANPSYFGTTPIVDWLNTAHFAGFFNPTMTYTLVNRPYHNDFDSFNQWNFWVEPFGFNTQFNNGLAPLKFDQYTLGIIAGGEYTFFDRLVLGLGLAYSHSGIDGKEIKNHADLNSLYFGPAIHYVFTHGYLGCTLFGVANFYHIERDVDLFPTKSPPKESMIDYMSWDLVLRLEGGLAFEPGYQFFLYPMVRIDYLTVFQNGATEQFEKDVELVLEGFNESFFCSKVGMEMTREFYTDSLGFITPSLSFGWLNFSPISTEKYQFHLEECKELTRKIEPNPWNQYYFGAGLSLVLKRGMLFSLDYELTAGADSPVHAGSLRFELSW